MGLKVTIEHPDFPKGYEFSFAGVDGVIENGGSLVISDAQVEQLPEGMFEGPMYKTAKVADPKLEDDPEAATEPAIPESTDET